MTLTLLDRLAREASLLAAVPVSRTATKFHAGHGAVPRAERAPDTPQ